MARPSHHGRHRGAGRCSLNGRRVVDHVAVEVSDFDARVEFLTATMGMTLQRMGELVSDPSRRVAMIGDGTGFKLELVEARAETGGGADRLSHVAFRVDDVDAEVEALVADGCVVERSARRFEPARSRTATLTGRGDLQVQLVAYDPDSPDR
ncbi:MAG: VOC family protein [Ilumatobacteraceae bacterium]